jgi:hypothetical protein
MAEPIWTAMNAALRTPEQFLAIGIAPAGTGSHGEKMIFF